MTYIHFVPPPPLHVPDQKPCLLSSALCPPYLPISPLLNHLSTRLYSTLLASFMPHVWHTSPSSRLYKPLSVSLFLAFIHLRDIHYLTSYAFAVPLWGEGTLKGWLQLPIWDNYSTGDHFQSVLDAVYGCFIQSELFFVSHDHRKATKTRLTVQFNKRLVKVRPSQSLQRS
ncbi:hypothetical protein FIM1_4040 [Kluyveromyces marxianus]|uniref:Uncharacterized protein n=1 Tax=Kluyveromyces marxianus TaxID=4911 RepID=A0ABX6F1U4_KLUMA|nr:hypothetical protein FIM1_4040 [Kluyveromyces marxianus]